MSERPADLHSELRRLAAEDLAAGGHPPPEDLIAYHEGSLPEPRAEELREHLAVCADCAALLLDYDEHWADGAESAAETKTAYEPWHRRVAPLRALAAGLAAVAIGAGAWAWLERTVPAGAESAYQTRNIAPEGSGGDRSGGQAEPIRVPANAGSVVLNLDVPDVPDEAAGEIYTAALRSGGETVDTVEGPLDDRGQFTMTVPRRVLHPGDWEIELLSRQGAAVGTYRFTVAPPEEPGAEH